MPATATTSRRRMAPPARSPRPRRPPTIRTGSRPDASSMADADEVVVTATRRENGFQDVPLSITAFQQGELTRKGIVGFEGVARETPGVVLNRPTQNSTTSQCAASPPTATAPICRAPSPCTWMNCRCRRSAIPRSSIPICLTSNALNSCAAPRGHVRIGIAVRRDAYP